MTEEEKRYSESEAGLIFDSKTGWYIHGLVVDRLNAYESRVKELEHAITRYQQGRSVLMPKELTAENGAKDLLMGEFFEVARLECPHCDEEGEDCDCCEGEAAYTYRVPISWAAIKEIYSMCVSNLSVRVSK
jgi:hypothetical protein